MSCCCSVELYTSRRVMIKLNKKNNKNEVIIVIICVLTLEKGYI